MSAHDPALLPDAVPVIDAGTLMRSRGRVVVDMRSPVEFAEDHVPGAWNVPLFDDVQRALVGTLYQTVSPDAAFEAGREMVRESVVELVGAIARHTGWTPPRDDLRERVVAMTSNGYERTSATLMALRTLPPPPDPVVVHCWRGGLRSRSVLALLRALGLERATLLDGGYKGYRAWVRDEVEQATFPRFVVLHGLTGVGKTLVLREIERLRPRSTIDLEALAGHRSSLLGMVGLAPCTQKMFESRLCERLAQGFADVGGRGPLAIVEGESRKVGDVILPPALWRALEGGTSLSLETTVDRRVQVLCEDYLADEAHRAELRRRLPHVDERLVRASDAESLVSMLDSGRTDELVRLLLERYYDPLYRHAVKGKVHAGRVDAADPARAAREILAWCDAHGAA